MDKASRLSVMDVIFSRLLVISSSVGTEFGCRIQIQSSQSFLSFFTFWQSVSASGCHFFFYSKSRAPISAQILCFNQPPEPLYQHGATAPPPLRTTLFCFHLSKDTIRSFVQISTDPSPSSSEQCILDTASDRPPGQPHLSDTPYIYGYSATVSCLCTNSRWTKQSFC